MWQRRCLQRLSTFHLRLQVRYKSIEFDESCTSRVAELLRHPVRDVLRKQGSHLGFAKVFSDSTLETAAKHMRECRSSCLIVLNRKDSSVSGIISENDILSFGMASSEIKERDRKGQISPFWNIEVKDAMTPRSKLVLITPDDSIWSCIHFFTSLGVKRLPVIDKNSLTGLISVRDVLRYLYREIDGEDRSGKESYLENVVSRKGIPANVVVDRWAHSKSIGSEPIIGVHFGSSNIPHPHKKATGGEDASFFFESGLGKDIERDGYVTVMGIADGVGSWSYEYGIDASKFSSALMQFAKQATEVSTREMKLDTSENSVEYNSLSPFHIIDSAWHRVSKKNIIGSSTACILVFDGVSSELHAANLGDSGFLVLRRSETSLFGSIDLQRQLTRSSEHRFQVLFRSPQQLHYFNCPYQLGISENTDQPFDLPTDCDRLRIPVIKGDIVVLATDGLFDNLHEGDILEICSRSWERGLDSNESLQQLSSELAKSAYEASQRSDIDSPFALLAKENDIMWGGGMPDDITVLVACVTPVKMK